MKFIRTGAPKVERTAPGSKNEYRITYDNGSQKWTNDRPGDGGSSRQDKRDKDDRLSQSNSKSSRSKLDKKFDNYSNGRGDDSGVDEMVDGIITNLGRELARETFQAWFKSKQGVKGKGQRIVEKVRKRYNHKLRSAGMDNNKIASELLKLAKILISEDFPSEEALKKYLKEHPDADRRNHRVVKTKKTPSGKSMLQERWEQEEPVSGEKIKGLTYRGPSDIPIPVTYRGNSGFSVGNNVRFKNKDGRNIRPKGLDSVNSKKKLINTLDEFFKSGGTVSGNFNSKPSKEMR